MDRFAVSEVQVHGLGLTDIIIISGVLAYLLDRLVDARGWSRSSRTLRRENEDLVRRNGELEATVERLDAKITSLEEQVRDLRRSDQAAVLSALNEHERGAMQRHNEHQAMLAKIVAALEGGTS